jgi:hypothetical protein
VVFGPVSEDSFSWAIDAYPESFDRREVALISLVCSVRVPGDVRDVSKGLLFAISSCGFLYTLSFLANSLSGRAAALLLFSSSRCRARTLSIDSGRILRISSKGIPGNFNNSFGGSYLFQSVGSVSEALSTTGSNDKYEVEFDSPSPSEVI